MISDDGLLYIEPLQPASPAPVIDHITRKMCAAYRKARRSDWEWGGVHECRCGAHSTSHDFWLPSEDLTNSLCVHYVAHHRSEVPLPQLAKIEAFSCGEVVPNDRELQSPELILERVRAGVESSLDSERIRIWTTWGLDLAALTGGLRGGGPTSTEGATQIRQDADDLMMILYHVKLDALPVFEHAVRKEHQDMMQWAKEALCIPGWNREAWVRPLVAIVEDSGISPMSRCSAMEDFPRLGPAVGAAVPNLIALRKEDEGNLHHPLDMTIRDLGQVPDVQVPAEIAPELVEIAEGENFDREFRVNAARILGLTGLATDVAVRTLLEILFKQPRYRNQLVAVLLGPKVEFFGEPGIPNWEKFAGPTLRDALRNPDIFISNEAKRFLDRLDPETREAVMGGP